MKECKLCGKFFPSTIIIDGKRRNLSNRKYCLECSPFGKHNTSPLEKREQNCVQCGKELRGNQRKYCSKKCAIIFSQKKRLQNNKQKAIDYMGGKCQVCGYNRYNGALDFHHLDPTKKDKRISRYCYIGWDKLKEELDKCILVCSNCHREIHGKIINIETLK
jgi:predicted nucleic acid-binding Zn ribbon protein